MAAWLLPVFRNASPMSTKANASHRKSMRVPIAKIKLCQSQSIHGESSLTLFAVSFVSCQVHVSILNFVLDICEMKK